MVRRKLAIVAALAVLLLSIPLYAQQVTLTLALREDIPTVAIYERLIAEFEEENPGITVEIYNVSSTVFNENILVQVAAGIPPDVLYTHYTFFPELARQGLLYDLTEFIERDNYDFDDFFPPTIDQLTWKGNTGLALPRETSSAAMFYNMDAFDNAGVPHPFSGWTYDDMVEMARKLVVTTDGVVERYGVYGATTWFHRPNIIWSFGAEILNEDNTKFRLHEPEGVAAIQWIADLHTVSGVATNEWANRFATGRSAMEFSNYWQILGSLNNAFEWDVHELPAGPAGTITRTATGGHAIMAGTRHPEEAWKLLQHISSTESLTALAQTGVIVPARRTAALAPEFLDGKPSNRRAFIDAIATGRPDTVPEQVNDLMTEYLSPVWAGAKPARTALEEVRPLIDQKLAELAEQ